MLTGQDAGKNRIAVVKVPRDFLAELLRLPPGASVVDISMHAYFLTDEVAIKVAHPDFPEVVEGADLPRARPLYRSVTSAEFVGWDGLPSVGHGPPPTR